MPMLAVAIMQLLCAGVSFAQSDAPANYPVPIVVRSYDLPTPLKVSENEGVSSEEFERFISSKVEPQSNPPNEPTLSVVESVPGPLTDVANSATVNPPQSESTLDPFPTDEVGTSEARYIPWWQDYCLNPLLAKSPGKACTVDLEQLIWQSMQYSPKVQRILISPQIQRTEEQVARGELDLRRFGKTRYNNTSDPVGNTLTTGGPTRLNEEFWENSVGIRRRNALGGKSEIAQMLNAKDSNSLFFKPNNQADAKLSLNYTQPLLRGSGRFYNTSEIRLAGIKTQGSIATANRELQEHALNVIDTYWELTLNRYLLAQARNGQVRLRQIKQLLQNRSSTDLIASHLHRATAAIANQQGQIESAKARIIAREESLRHLVNSPGLDPVHCQEIVPVTLPTVEMPDLVLEDELCSAILHRGDIVAIQTAIERAVVQRKLAANELKPQLDLVANSYVRGLRGDNDVGGSLTDQFATGRPSFYSGLEYSAPAGNRSAKANLTGRELEQKMMVSEYSDALLKAQADIKSAIAASQGTYASSIAAVDRVLATKEELEGLKTRFEDFLGDNPSVSNVLNDLLDAEERLIVAENTWATKQIEHMQALYRIQYESGTLMTITAE
jgi:outer membrane protein